jgi:hypothetical protein
MKTKPTICLLLSALCSFSFFCTTSTQCDAQNKTQTRELDQSRRRGQPMRRGFRPDDNFSLIRGEIAPDFNLKSLDGKSETRLAKFRGQKPVVLFFGSYT